MESLARIPHAVAHMLHQQAPCHCVQLGAFFPVSGARAVGGGRSTFIENNCRLAPAVLRFCWAVLVPLIMHEPLVAL
jgi:Na+-translocating ferredoxin:NAD+ oxidoreductase RnfD subunit